MSTAKATRKTMPRQPALALPTLSDDAAAEIYLFIEQLLGLFEARYGIQVRRFYRQRNRDNLFESDHDPDMPPF